MRAAASRASFNSSSALAFSGFNSRPIDGGFGHDVVQQLHPFRRKGHHRGDGIDTLDYGTSDASVKVNLATGSTYGGDAQGDQLLNFENLNGSDHADTLTGDSGSNILWGSSGNDMLQGADILDGADGMDTASYSASASGVQVALALDVAGTGTGGDAEGDMLYSVENLTGSTFGDTLTGSSVSNTLSGGSGTDLLSGAAGTDKLIGSVGDDVLIGGTGADNLNGGADADAASYTDAIAGVTAKLASTSANTGDAKGDVFELRRHADRQHRR